MLGPTLWTLLGASFLLAVAISPFWRKMQISTLWVGKMIAPKGADQELPRGTQDAITPRYQDTLNLIMPIAWLLIMISGSAIHWYLGIALFVLALVISAASSQLYPRSLNAYLRLIISDMTNRMADYRRDGDDMRASAAAAALDQLSQLYQRMREQQIRVPSMPEVRRMPLGGFPKHGSDRGAGLR